MDAWSSPQAIGRSRTAEFMAAVYRWMAFGLGLSGLTAWAVISSPGLLGALYRIQDGRIVGSSPLLWIATIGWVILGMAFTPLVQRVSMGAAVGMFLSFCAISGLIYSGYIFQFTGASVASTLFITGGAFFGLSLYATVTKRDLSGMRTFLMMGLIGLIVAGIVNIFIRSAAAEFVISCMGVVIFSGLTAWDTQRIRAMGETGEERHALIGALALYLDFINLFLYLLRFFGRRRD
jgi:FtsH-binding integral membrane protein